ncbi:MAG: GNAT family N-acetyltransferase [Desulfobacterales bacterium]
MRRLFYRFSGQTVYRRFHVPISRMPHEEMQQYVNIDYGRQMSVVALVGEPEQETIIAEARYVKDEKSAYAELAFVVDERYQKLGIASYLYETLIRLAQERGLKGFTAEVLQANTEMMKVFEKGPLPVNTHLKDGVYSLTIDVETPSGE